MQSIAEFEKISGDEIGGLDKNGGKSRSVDTPSDRSWYKRNILATSTKEKREKQIKHLEIKVFIGKLKHVKRFKAPPKHIYTEKNIEAILEGFAVELQKFGADFRMIDLGNGKINFIAIPSENLEESQTLPTTEMIEVKINGI